MESLGISRELADRRGIADALFAFARLSARQKNVEQAARLWGAEQRLREEIGLTIPPAGQEDYEKQVSALREALGDEAFSVAWAEGRALTMEQAIEYALKEVYTMIHSRS